jgi:hypothetical protein
MSQKPQFWHCIFSSGSIGLVHISFKIFGGHSTLDILLQKNKKYIRDFWSYGKNGNPPSRKFLGRPEAINLSNCFPGVDSTNISSKRSWEYTSLSVILDFRSCRCLGDGNRVLFSALESSINQRHVSGLNSFLKTKLRLITVN